MPKHRRHSVRLHILARRPRSTGGEAAMLVIHSFGPLLLSQFMLSNINIIFINKIATNEFVN